MLVFKNTKKIPKPPPCELDTDTSREQTFKVTLTAHPPVVSGTGLGRTAITVIQYLR